MKEVKIAKKITLTIMITLMFFTLTVTSQVYSADDIKVIFNGNRLDFDVQPIIKNNRTLVPIRKISEALGATVTWDNLNRAVEVTKGSTKIVLKIGNSTAYINQTHVKLDMPPIIIHDRTLVPIRFISEAFGADVSWEGKTRTVMINTYEKQPKYILGFYYSQSYKDFISNIDNMSAIAAKWYTLDSDGNITNNDSSRWIMTPDGYEDVIKLSKNNNLEVNMLIFENDKNKLEKVLATEETRTNLANQIVSVVEKEGYDGVNIDFEYVKGSDKDRFSEFIKELYKILKSKNKGLNLSLPVKTEKADWWPGYDFETLGKYCDFVVLMAYDKNPANPEPQSAINWVEEVVDYAIARIPANKVVLGIGYYGYDWSNSGKAAVVPKRNEITYKGILSVEELAANYGLKLKIDENSGMYYGNYTDEKGIFHEIWMESDYSVDKKAKLVINKGLKGIAVWRLGYTVPSFWETVNNNFTAK